MRVYIAAPLFNDAEKTFNYALTTQLEIRGHRVFLPQRDGVEMSADAGDAPDARAREIFQLDTTQIMSSDLVIAVLDGRVPDEGVCVEIGVAWATRHARPDRKTPSILGLMTDLRSAFGDAPLNPMIAGALDGLAPDLPSLLREINEFNAELQRRPAGR